MASGSFLERPFGLSWGTVIGRGLRHLFSMVLAFTMLMPFFWMLSTSLKDLKEVFTFPPEWIPETLLWSNYVRIFEVVPFARYFLNSLIMVVGILIGQLTISTLAAYAFSAGVP